MNDSPSRLLLLYALGDTYLQLGQLEKAEKYFEKRFLAFKKTTIHNLALYNYLYLLEKKRTDYVRALAYKEKI
mgnify:CR=1 FL=1